MEQDISPEQLRIIVDEFRRIYGPTLRLEGQTAETPLGYGTTHIADGRRIFTTMQEYQPRWIVDVDERTIHITENGYHVRATAPGNIFALITADSTLRLGATRPTTENFVRQSGDGSTVLGSPYRDVIDATRLSAFIEPLPHAILDGVTTGGDLGHGNDEVRVSAATSNVYYDGQGGRDTINLDALRIGSSIRAIISSDGVMLDTAGPGVIGQFDNFQQAKRGESTLDFATILADHGNSNGLATVDITIGQDNALHYAPATGPIPRPVEHVRS